MPLNEFQYHKIQSRHTYNGTHIRRKQLKSFLVSTIRIISIKDIQFSAVVKAELLRALAEPFP